MSRRRILILAAAIAAVLLLVLAVLLTRVERRRALPREAQVEGLPAEGVPPVAQWTRLFRSLDSSDLAELLERIETTQPEVYRRWSLGYLHARALADAGEESDAIKRLEPLLKPGNPLRDLALRTRASIGDDAEASRYRNALIFEESGSPWRDEAVEDEIAWLGEQGDPAALDRFATRIAPKASTALRRDLSARMAELLASRDDLPAARTRAIALLRGGTDDDAADRAARAIDRDALVAAMPREELLLLADALQKHRHYDRAIPALRRAVAARYDGELQFALGRSYFGNEQFEEAQAVYVRGANAAKKADEKALFLWHAARSAQLRGDDATAERLMTSTIAVKGTFPSTTAALTQRIRTRVRRKQDAAAAADLALLRRFAGNRRASFEGALALAMGQLAHGNDAAARATLAAVPRSVTAPPDRTELAYWIARTYERSDPNRALAGYLDILASGSASLYAKFASQRLAIPALQQARSAAIAVRDGQLPGLLQSGKYELALRLQTERVHLSGTDRGKALEKLEEIYRAVPAYRSILELTPEALPAFPLEEGQERDRGLLLGAMGLYDDAAPELGRRWNIRPTRSALTRSWVLNLGGASHDSIYAIEVLMRSVPSDYVYELLPPLVRQLLHPRYFADAISKDAERYDADPALVLAIMREESRFDPRAKSQAAARGLLQFIITTARDIGRSVGIVDLAPEDLYDPRVIIQLGAKYIGDLSKQFGGDGHRIAAAYNAGPKQTELWSRLQPAPGDDFFLAAVNFDETKDYVRKVMNAYGRYRQSQ